MPHVFCFISSPADLLNLDQVEAPKAKTVSFVFAREKKLKKKTQREIQNWCDYSPIAALITMPIEDAEKFVRKEPLEQFYDVGNELGR